MSEIADAVQIIRVTLEGMEIAIRVGSGSLRTMQKVVKFLHGMLVYEKQMGKTTMKKLLMRGGDLQVLQFKKDDLKKVQKYAKKYGILYSVFRIWARVLKRSRCCSIAKQFPELIY
jgi:hypothetical protein